MKHCGNWNVTYPVSYEQKWHTFKSLNTYKWQLSTAGISVSTICHSTIMLVLCTLNFVWFLCQVGCQYQQWTMLLICWRCREWGCMKWLHFTPCITGLFIFAYHLSPTQLLLNCLTHRYVDFQPFYTTVVKRGSLINSF